VHSQSFDKARLKENLRQSQAKGGKARFQALKQFLLVETWDRQLSKMEEVLIMELVVSHLVY